jgi:hypothetical protein
MLILLSSINKLDIGKRRTSSLNYKLVIRWSSNKRLIRRQCLSSMTTFLAGPKKGIILLIWMNWIFSTMIFLL